MNEFLTGCAALVIVVLAGAGLFAADDFVHLTSTGPGTHTGYITAVEQEGYIFRNYRVYVKTDNQSSQEDVYCLDRNRQDLVKEAQALSQKRELVSVDFAGVRGLGFGLCDGVQITNITQDK
jgi:hypothetical protein